MESTIAAEKVNEWAAADNGGRFAGSVFVVPLSIQIPQEAEAELYGPPSEATGSLFPSHGVREHLRMRDDLVFMSRMTPQRQRVSVRAVTYRGLPVLYPPYHWLADGIRGKTIDEVREAGGRDLLAMLADSEFPFMGEDHSLWDAMMMFGLLNVRVYPAPGESTNCCAPTAELTIELTLDGEDVRRISMSMYEDEQGVYYVDDPGQVAGLVVREVVSFGDRPLMTVVGLSGVNYEPVNYLTPVEYAVRWGGFVLEYGSHYVSDQNGLIQ